MNANEYPSITICLNTIEKVRSFNDIISKCKEDFELHSNRYIVDAKSIMGIFSLDLTKPMKLVIHSLDKNRLNIIYDLIEAYTIN